jgi:hypothetical protein
MRSDNPISRLGKSLKHKVALRSYSPTARVLLAASAVVAVWLLITSHSTTFDDSEATIYNSTLGVCSSIHNFLLTTSDYLFYFQFGDVFVISLPSRPDRRDAMSLLAAVTGMHFSLIDGVSGESVPEKALPPGIASNLKKGAIGSWRAHMNAIRT